MRKSSRKGTAAALALLALGAWLSAPTAAPAAPAPAPAWSIVAYSLPTNLGPGGGAYQLRATNVGGAPTTSSYTISDTLPAGLQPAAGAEGQVGFSTTKLTCQTSGQTISCSGNAPVVAGETVNAKVPLSVEAGAEGSVIDEATIEGGGATPVTTTTTSALSPLAAPFDFLAGREGHFGWATSPDGTAATQAGSHPYQLTVGMGLPSYGESTLPSGGGAKDIVGELPRGTVVNPTAVPVRCREAEFELETCPAASQVGTVLASVFPFVNETKPLYSMVAPPGEPGEFAFAVLGEVYAHVKGGVRSDNEYRLFAGPNDILGKVAFLGTQFTLWGNPTDESHDAQRGGCVGQNNCHNSVERRSQALLTMPSDCRGPITTNVRADSWEEIGAFKEQSYESADPAGNPVGISGCNQLQFEPTIEAKPTTNLADSPSGLDFDLRQPQEEEFKSLSTANLKDATVTLPEGMSVNPSSADGLGACEEADAHVDQAVAASCPGASKLALAEVTTPLVDHPLSGALYLAKPYANPFGSLLALYLSVADPQSGVVSNLAGEVKTDPNTGQLTTTFEESPELPLNDVKLHFFTGARAALRTPSTCATYTTTSDLVPWSTPEGADAHPSDSFTIIAAPGASSCPTSPQGAPNSPAFAAGTIAPQAGAYSPFVLKASRADDSQPLAGLQTTLPPGLSGRLAGIPYCPEADIAKAKSREAPNGGQAEIADPSCPAASEVGTVDVGAGAGPTPLHVSGRAYLAGPYEGAPLSVVVITPAVAGPFDLGTVVVRVALHLDPETAQIHAVSDPFPQIIDGIPVDLRSVSLEMGRPSFTLNPTSCDPMAVGAVATSALGQAANLSSPFQVGGCGALAFKPRLSLRLKGKTNRGGHPALTAIARFKAGQANTKLASVTLPHSAFLDQAHIGTVCTRVQFSQGSVPGAACPARSIYGKATATTPLLEQPLSGPVFLRSSSHELPDLVVALHGQVDVVLAGRVDSVKGGIRSTFEALPDAPVTKFTLQMRGGKKGLIVNSRNLCASTQRATVLMDGQNGKANDFRPVVRAQCGGKGRKGKKHKKG